MLHTLQQRDRFVRFLHQDRTKLLSLHLGTRTAHVEVDFPVPVLDHSLHGNLSPVLPHATNLADHRLLSLLESQVPIEVFGVYDRFVDDHFRPEDQSLGEDPQKGSKLAGRVVQHGSDMELLVWRHGSSAMVLRNCVRFVDRGAPSNAAAGRKNVTYGDNHVTGVTGARKRGPRVADPFSSHSSAQASCVARSSSSPMPPFL